jgi:hypothetical protein
VPRCCCQVHGMIYGVMHNDVGKNSVERNGIRLRRCEMLFVWVNDMPRKTAFKCNELPTDGNGKAIKYVTKHELSSDEVKMSINELIARYPFS